MNRENLHSILWDLTNINTFVKESIETSGYSNFTRSTSDRLETFIDEVGINKIEDVKKRLKDIQEECEKDNTLAKKTITISRPDLIKGLIESSYVCGKKLVSFSGTKFSSIEKMHNDAESVEKSIEKVNELCDEVFSFKDDFDRYYVVKECLSLVKEIKDIDNIFNILDDCLDSVKDDESKLNDFNEYRHDNDSSSDFTDMKSECAILYRKLNAYRDLLSSYYSQVIKIYKKSYEMISGLK